jgi:adenine-specific DNA methylase
MNENKEEKDYRRHKIIQEAVASADKIIMDSSDGTEKETNYLTASVALELMRIAFLPFGMRTIFFKPGKIVKRDVIQRAVNKALKTIIDSASAEKTEVDYLVAQAAKEFSDKSLRPFGAKMLEKDLKIRYGGNENYGRPKTDDPGDR